MNIEQQLYQALLEIRRLQQENSYLKQLLKQQQFKANETLVPVKPININEQTKETILRKRVQIFKSLFRGRDDVYAVRWQSKNLKSGYIPACALEWQKPLCQKPMIKCSQCQVRQLMPLTDEVIYRHLAGEVTIGLYPLLKDETCWFLAVDFDKRDWQKDIQAFVETCQRMNIPVSIERSRSGNGGHVWIFFSEPVSAKVARQLGNFLLSETLSNRYELGMDSYDRLFPNQDTLPKGGFGNLIALPLQRGPRMQGNSVFIDENFNPYEDQWGYLQEVRKLDLSSVKKIVSVPSQQKQIIQLENTENNPVEKLPSALKIIEKNGLHLNKHEIPSHLMHELLKLSSLKNPEFFKAQAKRLSTHGIPKNINCHEETADFIILPRGCKEALIKVIEDKGIAPLFDDQTQIGKAITANFKGVLTSEQQIAVEKLLDYPIGILSAATGFGKTVIAAALIAQRKVNTLIIVHRKQLMEQWKERLNTFIDKGTLSGQIGGGKNKQTFTIDIVTIQSLNYRGEIKDDLTKYGQIIVDECHHISAVSFEKVMKKVEAKYVCGLTATPMRKDGLHPIMMMQLGPIRYKVTAKSNAKVHSFEHILHPRYTNFKCSMPNDTKQIQEIYKEIVHDSARNYLIFDDVLKALSEGAAPLILTERLEHVKILEEMFKNFVKNIIVLTGGMKSKEQLEKLNVLQNLNMNEERLIIATGKYIGEGFDNARLDTLFLVMPLSWKGTLQQYVGRLHRAHDNKSVVKVYDYIDQKVPMLQKMFDKRLKAYQSMGYKMVDEKNRNVSSTEQIKLF